MRRAWISSAWTNPRLVLSVSTDIASKRLDDAIVGKRALEAGKPVEDHLCPQRIWLDKGKISDSSLPDLFLASGFWIISERAKLVFDQFELGAGSIWPVVEGLYQSDNMTPVNGRRFTWVPGNRLSALSFEESQNLRAPKFPGGWHFFPDNLTDDDVAIDGTRITGVNTWIDPMLFNSLFFSPRLGDALVAAGLQKAFQIYGCRVI